MTSFRKCCSVTHRLCDVPTLGLSTTIYLSKRHLFCTIFYRRFRLQLADSLRQLGGVILTPVPWKALLRAQHGFCRVGLTRVWACAGLADQAAVGGRIDVVVTDCRSESLSFGNVVENAPIDSD